MIEGSDRCGLEPECPFLPMPQLFHWETALQSYEDPRTTVVWGWQRTRHSNCHDLHHYSAAGPVSPGAPGAMDTKSRTNVKHLGIQGKHFPNWEETGNRSPSKGFVASPHCPWSYCRAGVHRMVPLSLRSRQLPSLPGGRPVVGFLKPEYLWSCSNRPFLGRAAWAGCHGILCQSTASISESGTEAGPQGPVHCWPPSCQDLLRLPPRTTLIFTYINEKKAFLDLDA